MYAKLVTKISHWKVKQNNTSNEKTDYKFHALTPTDNADLGIYKLALDYVFSENDVKNVAISGAYGAGKSSVIASYKKSNLDKKFLHISLAHFQTDDENQDGDKDSPNKTTESILEGKIINQLIHQISPEKIPRTNFRVKKETSKCKNMFTAVLAVVGIIFGTYTFFFSTWVLFVNSITWGMLRNLFDFSTYAESRLCAGIVFIVIVCVFAYRLAKLQEYRQIISKANVSGLEIEIFKDS